MSLKPQTRSASGWTCPAEHRYTHCIQRHFTSEICQQQKQKQKPLSYLFLDLICVVKIVQCEGPLLLRVVSRLHVTLHALCSHANMLSE